MRTTDFSVRFDVLYDNAMSNAAPGLNEYEKSVYLTKALYEILKNHLNPAGNKYHQGLDQSPRRQIDFSTLMVTSTLQSTETSVFFDSGRHYKLPTDMFSIVNELVYVGNSKRIIVPISNEEYERLATKPYRYPAKRQAWRIINDANTAELILNPADEDVLNDNSNNIVYKLLYIRNPKPIILTNLEEYGVTINGETNVSECELSEVLHEEILQRAVELAKAAYGDDQNGQLQMQNQITVGQRSE